MTNKDEYELNISHLREGQEFKSFTELCQILTGEKPPTGKRNQDALKRKFRKYFEFCLKYEIEPSETSKRKLVITKIYDEPIRLEENRGRHGKYADIIKPLLLYNVLSTPFEGKMYELLNSIGVFQENKSYNPNRNPWKVTDTMMPGKQEYMNFLWHQMRSTVERSLDSMQKEGLIQWEYYHKLIPNILVDVEYRLEKRFRTRREVAEDSRRRNEFLEKIISDNNSVLLPETIELLNINSPKWDGIHIDVYKQQIYIEDKERLKPRPLRATPKQEVAIENLQQFYRQYAYKKCYRMNRLPSKEEIPNGFEFFQNISLSNQYRKLTEEMSPWLIGCTIIWRELEYKIITEPERLNRYLDIYSFEKSEYATLLSRNSLSIWMTIWVKFYFILQKKLLVMYCIKDYIKKHALHKFYQYLLVKVALLVISIRS